MYEFMKKFNPDGLMIKEFKYWVICLRAKQVTIGSAIILLKRETPSIGDMTVDEAAEFAEVINWYETKCKKIYNAEKFNYVAAMMKDNFVHYHAFPRYSKSFVKHDIEWIDQDWPRIAQFREVSYADDVLKTIISDFTE